MTTAISPSRVGSIYGSLTTFKNLAPGGFAFPQRIAVIAQGNTATVYAATKVQMFSAQQAGETYGFGSQIHEICLQLLPASGDGVGSIPVTVYPMVDGTTESVGTITPVGTTTAAGTYLVKINNLTSASFQLASGAVIADATAAIETAVNAATRLPVTSVDGTTVNTLTCKWKGVTGDSLIVSVEGPSVGMTFTIVQPTAGAGNPAIDAAVLGQFGTDWETFVIQSNADEAASLIALAAHNEGRWDPTVNLPANGYFYTSVETAVATAATIPDARTTDRTNVQLSAPGSSDLPWALTARAVARMAKVANSASPASDYNRQELTGLTPGLPADQWDAAERETAVTSGVSTSEVRGGLISLSDTVTMYHPAGDPTPAYRYVNNINKLLNMLNDLKIEFDTAKWLAAPLIPDGQATTDKAARSPSDAEAELFRLIESWGLRALLSDPQAARDSVVVAINGGNPRRLDLALTVQLSGNAGIVSVDLNFGFFFGSAA